MPEVDPLIWEIRLQHQQALQASAQMENVVARRFDRLDKSIQKPRAEMVRLENQMRRSSAGISNSLRSIAGALGAYSTLR